ncbi:MAG: hypothetical protein MJ211_10340 [Bacteroidales bacterium]|nr:hypothetical protein [Bacteroidales bacterium]
METINFYYFLSIIGIFATSCCQILLKKSASTQHKSFVRQMLNWHMILSYSVFFICLFVNIICVKNGIGLKEMPILESLGYVFVPVLSCVFLHEKINFRIIISILLIGIGILIFYS